MPNYEMTPQEVAEYGDSLNVWQAMRLLQTWYPLIQYGQRFLGEADPYRKSLIVAEAAEWVASKTDATRVDDQLIRHLAEVLKTPQGESLLRWCVAQAGIK